MLGSEKRKAADHATKALSPLIAITKRYIGLPPGFWEDTFVLGFIGMMIDFHAVVTSGVRISQTDKVHFVFPIVFSALSKMDGEVISKKFFQLLAQEPRDPDFNKAVQSAIVCAAASQGKMPSENDPFYQSFVKAKELASAQGAPQDIGTIGGWLLQILFIGPFKQRISDEESTKEAEPGIGEQGKVEHWVTEEQGEAYKWHREAEHGSIDAMYALGICYKDGVGVPQDYAEAVKWLRQAAEQGHVKAQLSFGELLYALVGEKGSEVEEVKLYRRVADKARARGKHLTFGSLRDLDADGL